MNSNVFSGKTADWYSAVITGYVVAASTVSVTLAGVMAAGVI